MMAHTNTHAGQSIATSARFLRVRRQRRFSAIVRALLFGFGIAPLITAIAATPSTDAPSQLELDKADVDAANWLTSNKGYLGYRYSALTQLNAQNVRKLARICSFDVGERGSFQSALLVYQGVLYATSAFGAFAIDAATCGKRWRYHHKAGHTWASETTRGPR